MGAGDLNKRVTFQRATRTGDGGGGGAIVWNTLATVWAGFKPERGYERLRTGRIEAELAGVLTVRGSSVTRGVTEADRVLVDGVPYAIHAISNPDQRGRFLELTVGSGEAS